jgi:hypothetical protein
VLLCPPALELLEREVVGTLHEPHDLDHVCLLRIVRRQG